MKMALEATEMWLYIRMLRISWIEDVSNEEVIKKMETRRKLILIRKKGLEKMILTKTTHDILNELGKWMAEQGLAEITERQSLRATMVRKLWRAVIIYVLGETRLIKKK